MENESESTPKLNFPHLDVSPPLPPRPDRWGRWTLDAEQLVLGHEEKYFVSLDRFSSASPMLDMIVQVRNKSFMTTTDVGDLVAALDDIFNIQGSLAPFGKDRRIKDVPGFLRKRIAARTRQD